MKRLEIITLRSTGAKQRESIIKLIQPILDEQQARHDDSIQMYLSETVETDLSIHIHGHTAKTINEKSSLGHGFVEILSEFGLVSYTLWQEKGEN